MYMEIRSLCITVLDGISRSILQEYYSNGGFSWHNEAVEYDATMFDRQVEMFFGGI